MSQQLEENQRAGYCRHCGERLPLIKRVKREEFCSEEHRLQFLSSTTDVALGRLRESGTESQFSANGFEDGHGNSDVAVETAEWSTMPEADAHAEAHVAAEAHAAQTPIEPADPPMAGCIWPHVATRPLRLALVLDSNDAALSEWQPVKPEPEWTRLALHFGLAEFSEEELAAIGVEGSPAATDDGGETLEGPELVYPRNGGQLDYFPEPATSSSRPAEANAEPVTAWMPPLAPALTAGSEHPPIEHSLPGALQVRSPEAEPYELDTILYLPGFSLAAEEQSFETWAASWSESAMPDSGISRFAGRLTAARPDEASPLELSATAMLPIATGCSVEADPASATFEMLHEANTDASENGIDFDEHFLAPPEAPSTPAPLGEEQGMSEAVQTMAMATGPAAQGATGAGRVTTPFLHEPQPRSGSAKPRWSPVTASLNTSAEAVTEDWDIL